MKTKNKIWLIVLSLYLIFQLIYYILLHTTEIFNYRICCYSVIVMGLMVSIIVYLVTKYKNNLLISLAIFFTCFADFFLVILNDYYEIALVFFIFVQISYYLYILSLDHFIFSKKNQIFLLIRIFLVILSIILPLFVKIIDFLIFLAILYFPMLAMNVIESFVKFKQNYLLPWGLLLFSLCDICVGFLNAVNIFDFPPTSIVYKVAYSEVDYVWIFYHPAQVILSISGLSFLLKKHQKTY